jgi:hypothetical protein
MNPLWLVKMARWVRNPPSPDRVKLVVGVVVACFLLFGVEYFIGWPDWLTVDKVRAP